MAAVTSAKVVTEESRLPKYVDSFVSLLQEGDLRFDVFDKTLFRGFLTDRRVYSIVSPEGDRLIDLSFRARHAFLDRLYADLASGPSICAGHDDLITHVSGKVLLPFEINGEIVEPHSFRSHIVEARIFSGSKVCERGHIISTDLGGFVMRAPGEVHPHPAHQFIYPADIKNASWEYVPVSTETQ